MGIAFQKEERSGAVQQRENGEGRREQSEGSERGQRPLGEPCKLWRRCVAEKTSALTKDEEDRGYHR